MDRPGIPTLTTSRLVLRPFVLRDLDELAVIHAEESFWWYPLRSGMSKEETAGFLQRVTARYDSDGFGIEALLDRASGAMIGWAGLAVPHFLPEILPAVEFGFTTGGLDRIVSIYEPENVASGRVMEHLGFTLDLATTGQRGEELAVTELLRERWEEGRG